MRRFSYKLWRVITWPIRALWWIIRNSFRVMLEIVEGICDAFT